MDKNKLSPNSLAFIALANEYCHALENPFELDKEDFIASMLRLLPRIYISVSDIDNSQQDDGYFAESYLDEDTYNSVKSNICTLLEPDDVYLEVFMDDMKYSDTPLGTSISENLSDIYQVLFNVVAGVKDATVESTNDILYNCKEDFCTYWGQTLCNVLRALHALKFNEEYKFN